MAAAEAGMLAEADVAVVDFRGAVAFVEVA